MDFSLAQQDKIQIKGNLTDGYCLQAGDWNNNNVQDEVFMRRFAGDRPKFYRIFYTTSILISAILLVGLGKFSETINWSWNLRQVPFSSRSTGLSPGTGSLAAEAEVFLKFMSEYWVSGYENNPRIGEKRNNVWNRYTTHNGSLDGTHAWAIQLGGNNNPKEWKLPPVDDKGRILDNFSKLMMYSGNLPDGVDIFVAVNQRTDRKCVEAKNYDCGDAYGLLDNFILYGVSQVNWGAIEP